MVRRLLVGPDGSAIVILEDRRIGPELRKQMWGQSDDPDILFQSDDRRHAEFLRTPFLSARIRLLSPTGAVVAEKVAEHRG